VVVDALENQWKKTSSSIFNKSDRMLGNEVETDTHHTLHHQVFLNLQRRFFPPRPGYGLH